MRRPSTFCIGRSVALPPDEALASGPPRSSPATPWRCLHRPPTPVHSAQAPDFSKPSQRLGVNVPMSFRRALGFASSFGMVLACGAARADLYWTATDGVYRSSDAG